MNCLRFAGGFIAEINGFKSACHLLNRGWTISSLGWGRRLDSGPHQFERRFKYLCRDIKFSFTKRTAKKPTAPGEILYKDGYFSVRVARSSYAKPNLCSILQVFFKRSKRQ